MLLKKRDVLVIADVGLSGVLPTGGVLRSIRSIREYSKHFMVNLVIPSTCKFTSGELRLLKDYLMVQGVNRAEAMLKILSDSRFAFTYLAVPSKMLRMLLKIDKLRVKPEVIVVLNEPFDCLCIGRLLKEELNVPSLAMLQLPLFYHNKSRREAITNAYRLWYAELYRGDYIGKFIRELRTKLELLLAWSKIVKKLLKSFDMLIAVTKAVFIEMGGEPFGKFYIMNPGVSLDNEDIKLISEMKKNVKEKDDYIVFGGRVDALKGFIETLYAFRELVKRNSSLRLVITGYIGERLRLRVEKFIRRLSLEGKVVLTGNVSRAERFRIVAKANLMLYPSHVDAFSYSVLESLYLSTPVVAYDIPALKLHYSKCPGVSIVKEGDVEALVTEALNILSSGNIEVKPPQVRSWDEIMWEETNLIKSFLP